MMNWKAITCQIQMKYIFGDPDKGNYKLFEKIMCYFSNKVL